MYSQLFDQILIKENLVLQKISEYLNTGRGGNVTYFGAHSFNVFYDEPDYRDTIQNHFDIYTDGIGIYWLLKYIFKYDVEKFNASDLNDKIFQFLADTKTKTLIIGGRFDHNLVAGKLASQGIDGIYADGYDDVKDLSSISRKIKESEAKVVILGMGVPLQEKMALQLSRLDPHRIYICVGGFLEFYFGTVPRIPRPFRNLGVEWIFRIITEPRRLWKRYFVGVPLFLFRSWKCSILTEKSKAEIAASFSSEL
ncbi:MAG: WecB/TagA/CpsF family glycosyltransferase [Syntrophothermus sp.]